MEPPDGLPARDAAAIRRSYAFVIALSCGAWVVIVAVVSAVGLRTGGPGDAALAIVTITGLALLGWVLFLRGLRRRELARLAPPRPERYDPRSG